MFNSVDEILKMWSLNESYWTVLPCGTIYYAVHGGSNVWVCGSTLSPGHLFFSLQGAEKKRDPGNEVVCGWNPQNVIIQMKAIEQHYPVVLFIMLYTVVLMFEAVPGWNPQSVIIQMKATEQYCSVVLYKVVLSFEFVDGWNPKVCPFKW